MKRILIVYASFSGATEEIAHYVKQHMESAGYSVDLAPANSQHMDLSAYRLVILGAAIRGNTPNEGITNFISINKNTLSLVATAIFAVCGTITSTKQSRIDNALTYPNKIANGITPIAEAVFGGKMPSSGWFGNLIGKVLLGVTPGDYKNEDEVKLWAQFVIDKLEAQYHNQPNMVEE
ncbi:MAG: hypothetical protein JW783_06280 [Bacteroidales bacterium]|nr:hypothetical protein [Bacteroidales bacterium]MBN2749628.1 hypothetical protein [Bacteroidales bacterium]